MPRGAEEVRVVAGARGGCDRHGPEPTSRSRTPGERPLSPRLLRNVATAPEDVGRVAVELVEDVIDAGGGGGVEVVA